MTSPVTITQLVNAGTDCAHIETLATSTALTATDRTGTLKRTMAGAIQSIGWAVPVAYTAGINLTLANQTVTYDGELYAPDPADLPFTTSGTFETAKFIPIPEGMLRTELADSTGTDLIGYGGITLTTRLNLIKYVYAAGDGSDVTAAIQAVLDSGALFVAFPQPATAYGVTTLTMKHLQTLIGPGKYTPCLVGLGTGPVLQLGDGTALVRKQSILQMNIINANSGSCVNNNTGHNMLIRECEMRSTGASTIVALQAPRFAIIDSEARTSGAFTAIDALDNCNGIKIQNNIITGGTAGRAIRVGQCQVVSITDNVIESSLDGIHIASTSDSGDGNCNGVTVRGNYIEQCSTPLKLAVNFTITGLDATTNYISNSGTSVVAARTAAIAFGRIRSGIIARNSITLLSGVENLYDMYLPASTGGVEKLTVNDNFVTGTPLNVYTLNGAFAATASTVRALGAANNFDFANSFESEGSEGLREFISPVIDCAASVAQTTWLPESRLDFGGKIYAVEIIEVSTGTLSGTLRVGRVSSSGDTVLTDLTSITPANGYASIPLVTETALINSTENNTFQYTTAAGTATFRFRVKYRAN